jgi:hypothetical protein
MVILVTATQGWPENEKSGFSISVSHTFYLGDGSKKTDCFLNENIQSTFIKRPSFLEQLPSNTV